MEQVLVVEDDEGIRSGLVRALGNAGYECIAAPDAATARAIANAPNLILLDLGLPDADGLDLARELGGRWPSVPIMILTARAEEMDIVIGLDVGAVDYVVKPFRLAELMARIRAHLRQVALVDDDTDQHLSSAGIDVDLGARTVRVDGAEVALRVKEFDLLVELIAHEGRVVTREDLMANVWDEHWFGSTKTLDVHVASLRRRLGEAPGSPSRITSIRGVGYRWEREPR
ncbi:MAG: response regulator transcription factor [Microthrixaceae bacterium]